MGMFDGLDWGDPNAMAQLGALQGYGQAAMPSRMPVPFGAVQGLAAQGAVQGARGAQEYKQNQAKAASDTMANLQALQMLNLRNMAFGRPSLNLSDLYAGKIPDENSTMFGDVAQGASSPTQQPPGRPDDVLNGAPGSLSGGPVGGLITKNAVDRSMPQGGMGMPAGATRTPGGAPMPSMAGGPAPMSPAGMPAGPSGVPTPPPGMSPVVAGIMAQALGLSGYQAQKFVADSMPEGPDKELAEAAAVHTGTGFSPASDIRPGAVMNNYNWRTGKLEQGFRNPVLGEGETVDANNNVSLMHGAADALATRKNIEAEATGNQARKTAAFGNYLGTGGLGMGTAGGGLTGGPAPAGGGGGAGGAAPAPKAPSSVTTQPGGVAQTDATPDKVPQGFIPTEHGTMLPDPSQAAPIARGEKYVEARQEQWAKTENEWNEAQKSNYLGEQRALAIADALKKVQSGAWATNKAEIVAGLKSAGIPIPADIGNDPAQVQIALKDAFGSAMEQVKALTARPAASELVLALKNFANPNLQPEANQKILAQVVGQMRWERSLLDDWAAAKALPPAKNGATWQDPQDFSRVWRKGNNIQGFIDQAEKDIGPLMGMDHGPGSKFSHTTLPAEAQAQAAAIKQQYKAKTITAEQAQQKLKALGFPD